MAKKRDSWVVGLAEELIREHSKLNSDTSDYGRITRYLRGDHDLPYIPPNARAEYVSLAKKSITNWLPLISDTFTKALFVDGYRPARAAENAAAWEYWQANGMDARQSLIHRGALEYGVAYALVLPGDPVPVIRPVHPTKAVAFYEDEDDEWPVHALRVAGTRYDGTRLYEVLTNEAVYTVGVEKDGAKPKVISAEDHNLGVTPLVRYRESLEHAQGIILPRIVIQDRINEAVFSLMIALQYASFRQRWATGLAIPVDEQQTITELNRNFDPSQPESPKNPRYIEVPNPNFGKPIEPFRVAVDRLWVTDSPDAKFGDFEQTDVSGHLDTYFSAVRSLAAISQISPHVLLGDLVNVSADAFAVIEASTQRKCTEYEMLFGESHEQLFRLAALAAGDAKGARDVSAQVRWRDTEARSLAAAVDALGKMVSMLGVPAEAAWERIPGVTQTDVERWREMARSSDGLAALAEALTRQSRPSEVAA